MLPLIPSSCPSKGLDGGPVGRSVAPPVDWGQLNLKAAIDVDRCVTRGNETRTEGRPVAGQQSDEMLDERTDGEKPTT